MKIFVAYEKDIDDDLMNQAMYMSADAEAAYDALDSDEDVFVVGAIPSTTVKQFRRKCKNVQFILAVEKNKGSPRLVGMACVSKLDKHTLLLHNVYVKPLRRKAGIGSSLVKHALKVAKSKMMKISLSVNPLNGIAIHLYSSAGFKISKCQTIRMEFKNNEHKA